MHHLFHRCRFNILFVKRFLRLVRVVFPCVCSKSLLLVAMLVLTQSAGNVTGLLPIHTPLASRARSPPKGNVLELNLEMELGDGAQ